MASSSICRLCAVDCQNYMQVFEQDGLKSSIVEKIKQCLQIWVYPEDLLPKIICCHCSEKLDAFFSFFMVCHQTQNTLMEMVKKKDQNVSEAFSIFNIQDKDSDIYSLNVFEPKGAMDVECLLEDRGLRRTAKPPLDKNLNNVKSLDDFNNGIDGRYDSQDDDRSDRDDDLFGFDNKKCSLKKLFENYVWKCSDCDKECSSQAQLKHHYQEVHDRPPSFKCMQCSKIYDRYRSFARHVKLHNGNKRYSCEICGKCFSQKTVLQAHSTVHSEERPHVCPQCGKAFKQFSSLYLHGKCHLPDQAKPKYPCSVCFKVFSSKHTVETHMKIHTGERNYICDICGKTFISKGSLDYHILAHNDDKPHSCQVCGKCFKTARLLAKHSTLHTGVKPHQCDVCGKQFRERGALKEHNRIHTGAMPYSCEYCGKNFRFKGILTVHIRQHTGERPYRCGECRREFTNWANYNKHMKRRHKGVPLNNSSTRESETETILPDIEIPSAPVFSESSSQPPPPPYKLSDEDVFRSQGLSYPSPHVPMTFFIPPFLQRTE